MVRHGQSTWNVEHRWQGQANPPLSQRGRNQAHAATSLVGAVDAVISSPQDRALETAAIIANSIGVGPVQVVENLYERHIGVWSGMTTSEIEAAHPGWIDAQKRLDDWETDESVFKRVTAAMFDIRANFPRATLLVVTHGGVIAAIEKGLGTDEGRIPNLHGRIFTVDDGEIKVEERVELLPPELSTGGSRNRV